MPQEPETSQETVDPSHNLDLVRLFSSLRHDGESEAMTIRSLLDANGIPSLVVGPAQIPSLEFEVRVPRVLLEEAERILAEAQASGPSAAAEAEIASEGRE
jgi:hypothetical protein